MLEEGGRQRVRGECPAGQPLAQEPARRVRQAGDGCREEALTVQDMGWASTASRTARACSAVSAAGRRKPEKTASARSSRAVGDPGRLQSAWSAMTWRTALFSAGRRVRHRMPRSTWLHRGSRHAGRTGHGGHRRAAGRPRARRPAPPGRLGEGTPAHGARTGQGRRAAALISPARAKQSEPAAIGDSRREPAARRPAHRRKAIGCRRPKSSVNAVDIAMASILIHLDAGRRQPRVGDAATNFLRWPRSQTGKRQEPVLVREAVMALPEAVSPGQWLVARKELLAKEKEPGRR